MKTKYVINFLFRGRLFDGIESLKPMALENFTKCYNENVSILLLDPTTGEIDFTLNVKLREVYFDTQERIYEEVMEMRSKEKCLEVGEKIDPIDRLLDLQKIDCDVASLYLWVERRKREGVVPVFPYSDNRIGKIASYIEDLVDKIKFLSTPKK